ncbi:autotransporter domain-containing protein [Luteimonas weifangensis]|uniref:Autotransporter domain-containing protein n=2 Tax=Cognatiluteimonas weifangensis TaxID=2303539 RepID=A0A372DMX0_9GAMM|nr:autotransporter domain-containing protein [Luteimonas weifangensis]
MIRSDPPPTEPPAAAAPWSWEAPANQQQTPAPEEPLPPEPPPPAYNSTGDVYLEGPFSSPIVGVSTAGSFAFDGWWGGHTPLMQGWDGAGTATPNRFDGGVLIDAGRLRVQGDLYADVTIRSQTVPDGLTDADGTGRLDLEDGADGGIHGHTAIHGSVFNDGGVLYVHGPAYSAGNCLCDGSRPYRAYVTGDYRQTAAGTLALQFGTPLIIGGQAILEGGTLELREVREYVSYVQNATGYERILHAFGGVSGGFDQVVAPGLLLEGTVEYGANDILYRLTRVSAQSAVGGSGADAMTMNSAARLDQAFAAADVLASLPDRSGLSDSQRRFLRSSAAIQSIRDMPGLTATLDSLSGQSFASARSRLLDSFSGYGPSWPQLRHWRESPLASGSWAASNMQTRSGGAGAMPGRMSETGVVSGASHRLGPQALVGVAVGSGQASMSFDRGGGHALTRQSVAMLYGYAWRGPWYAYGEVQGGRGQVDSWRRIELGDGRDHQATTSFGMTRLRTRFEGGFDHAFGRGRLTPFAGLQYDAIGSGGFAETGDTGFELLGQAAGNRRLGAEAGLRYARDWHWGDGWLRLDAAGTRRHARYMDGRALAAAFAGAPDAVFRIDDAAARDASTFDLQLQGGRGAGWSGALRYRWGTDDAAVDRGWWLGVERRL